MSKLRWRLIDWIIASALAYVVSVVVLLPPAAFAHTSEQPRFLSVNGQETLSLPIIYVSGDRIKLAEESPQKTFLINQPVIISIKEDQLALGIDTKGIGVYEWDFGDGTRSKGLQVVHSYVASGSYFIKLNAIYTYGNQSQLLTTILVNVVPNTAYRLPVATIRMDGRVAKDGAVETDFTRDSHLMADLQLNQGVSVTSYVWDFGNQQYSTEASPVHRYAGQDTYSIATLRITDSNGLIADTEVLVTDVPDSQKNALQTTSKSRLTGRIWLFGAIGAALVTLVCLVIKRHSVSKDHH